MARVKNTTSSIKKNAKNNARAITIDSDKNKKDKLIAEYKGKLTKTANRNNKVSESNKTVESEKRAKETFAANQMYRQQKEYYTIKEFEKDVHAVEGIDIIVRGPKNAKVLKYSYKKRASNDTTARGLLIRRIQRILQHDYEVEILPRDISLDITLRELREL